MLQIDFKPKLGDAEEFYKKVEKKRTKIKQINEIEAFNNAKPVNSVNSEAFDNQFDLAEWKIAGKDNNDQSFFKQEGKTLLSDEQSFKKVKKDYLISDGILHIAIIIWGILEEYSPLSYLSNILMVIMSAILLAFHFKFPSIAQLYNNHKAYLLKLYKICECSLIISIMLSFTAIFHGLYIIYSDLLLLHSIKMVLYLSAIYIQLKILKNIKYIILVESELSKQPCISLQQTDAFQFA